MCTVPSMVRFRWWVLAWFLMSLGAATATPMIQPKALDVVCSSAGALKFFVLTDDGAVELDSDPLHCSLCLVGGAPPPVALSLPAALPAVTAIPLFQTFPRAVVATAAPPPARAPPRFF